MRTRSNDLIPLVYQELRRVGARAAPRRSSPATSFRRRPWSTRPTSVRATRSHERARPAHLLSLAARLMRQVLVDHRAQRRSAKRGGDAILVEPGRRVRCRPRPRRSTCWRLDEALGELATLDPRLSRVVELKFFAGLSIGEAAEAIGVSTATVERDWTVARAWLHRRLSRSGPAEVRSQNWCTVARDDGKFEGICAYTSKEGHA